MTTVPKHRNKRQPSSFELFTEILSWLQIVASPLLTGLGLGFIIYLLVPDTTGIVIGVFISVAGLIIGIVWATNVWKKKGTVHFMSEIMSTHELDEHKGEQEDSKP